MNWGRPGCDVQQRERPTDDVAANFDELSRSETWLRHILPLEFWNRQHFTVKLERVRICNAVKCLSSSPWTVQEIICLSNWNLYS